MPDDRDEGELGGAPTAVTAVVGGQRDRAPTQTLRVPDADPAWADGAIPPPGQTIDETHPQSVHPTPTPRQRLRALWRGMVHEYKKLPSRTRTVIVVAGSVIIGLLVGLLVAPSGGGSKHAPVDLSLLEHAQRIELDEREMVVRALSVSDTTAALMMLRSMALKDRLAVDPLALALRGRLALTARDGLDALDSFDAALAAEPKLAAEPWLAAAIVQTFSANKPMRTTGLLGKLAKPDAARALEAACMEWQARVRRGAQEALKTMGGACPDPVGVMMLDAYQAEKCDAARAVVQKLVPLERTDERIGAALDAISRRPPVAACVADLIPRR